MAYPQGTTITRANLLSEFNLLVITARNNSIVWSTDSAATNPFFPQNPYGTLVTADANPLAGSATAQLAEGDLPTNKISGAEIYNAFRSRTEQASAIRIVRLVKYLSRTGFGSGNGNIVQYDQSAVSSMSSGYSTSYLGSDFSTEPTSGDLIQAARLDTFINELIGKVNVNKDVTNAFAEYYCHSSCHSSCHNSRGRR
jgi:hypothetical protein